jgi:hypothetical protein
MCYNSGGFYTDHITRLSAGKQFLCKIHQEKAKVYIDCEAMGSGCRRKVYRYRIFLLRYVISLSFRTLEMLTFHSSRRYIPCTETSRMKVNSDLIYKRNQPWLRHRDHHSSPTSPMEPPTSPQTEDSYNGHVCPGLLCDHHPNYSNLQRQESKNRNRQSRAHCLVCRRS